MGARVGGRSRSGWFVSVPLHWIVIGGLVLLGTLVGGIAAGISYVGQHPASALTGIAKFVALLVVAGLALYGFCWMLAHRGRHKD